MADCLNHSVKEHGGLYHDKVNLTKGTKILMIMDRNNSATDVDAIMTPV